MFDPQSVCVHNYTAEFADPKLHSGSCSLRTDRSSFHTPLNDTYEWPGRPECLAADEQWLSSWQWCRRIGSASSSKIVSGLTSVCMRGPTHNGNSLSDWVIDDGSMREWLASDNVPRYCRPTCMLNIVVCCDVVFKESEKYITQPKCWYHIPSSFQQSFNRLPVHARFHCCVCLESGIICLTISKLLMLFSKMHLKVSCLQSRLLIIVRRYNPLEISAFLCTASRHG